MKSLSHVHGVVFDLDDTLYPEIDFVRSGFRAVAGQFRAALGPADAAVDRMWETFSHGDRTRVFDAVCAERGRGDDRALVAEMVRTYRGHVPSIRLHEDAARLLARLSGRMLLGVVSDGPLETQQNKIDALGLAPRVHAVELTNLYGRAFWKPHPRAFEQIARRLGCPHGELAYVADNAEKDFVAPNGLGWTTIQVRRADGVYRDRMAAPGGAPHHVVESLDELTFELGSPL